MYIPKSLGNQVIITFIHDYDASDEDVRVTLHEMITDWLAQFGFDGDYREYTLLPDAPYYKPELTFPLSVDVLHYGVGDKDASHREQNEEHIIDVERAPVGLHQRWFRYVLTLNKRWVKVEGNKTLLEDIAKRDAGEPVT
jgi:hypothetical protein